MAAVENEHGYVEHGSMDGPELAPYPPYVQTESDIRRWDAAYGIAEGLSKLYEKDGEPDPTWVWYTTRALYNDRSLPTGDGDEIQEAALEQDEEHVRELLAQLEDRAPAAASSGAELESYLEALADYFEGLLGNPDEWIPEDVERDYSHEIAAAFWDGDVVDVQGWPAVEEAKMASPIFRKPFNAQLHPRARGGKWASKFGAAKAIAEQHPEHVSAEVAKQPGFRQKLHKAHVIAVGSVQTALYNAFTSDPHEKIASHPALHGRKNVVAGTLNALAPNPIHAAHAGHVPPGQEALDAEQRVSDTITQSLDAARWAADHRDVLHAVGRVAHGIARMRGLAAAEPPEEETEFMRQMEEAGDAGADVHGAMIALYPSKAVQEKLAAHMPDGEPADDIHLTLVFLGPDASELEDKKTAITEAVREAASEHGPLKGEVGGIAAFRGAPDGKLRPVIATADVVGLNEFRADLMRQLRLKNVAPEETHGFTPHLTLKYAPKSDPVPEPPDALPLEFGEVFLVWDEERTPFTLSG